MVSLYGHISGHLAIWSCCLPGQLTSHSAFQCVQIDLEKYVLETLKVCCMIFKHKCPADTKDKVLVGISGEDEAEGLDLDPLIAHWAV